VVSSGSSGGTVSSADTLLLEAAIEKGKREGNWADAVTVLSKIPLKQESLASVNIPYIESKMTDTLVHSFARKMLGLVLVEKALSENKPQDALTRLASLKTIVPVTEAEMVARRGLVYLYALRDVAQGETVLKQLEALISSPQAKTIAAKEYYQAYKMVLTDYKERSAALHKIETNGNAIEKSKVETGASVPTEFGLQQNYPNPFNPTTTILYQIPAMENGEPVWVSLKVYDVLGREVATLVEAPHQPGYYQATFNGSRLASGVYFYKLSAGNFVEVKRMVLAK
jgi:hypothetical protein